MKKGVFVFGIIVVLILVIALVFGIYVTATYNSLVEKQEEVRVDWNSVAAVYNERMEFLNEASGNYLGSGNSDLRNAISDVETDWINARNVQSISGQIKAGGTIDELLSNVLDAAGVSGFASDSSFNAWSKKLALNEGEREVVIEEYNQKARDFNEVIDLPVGNYIAGYFGFAYATIFNI